MKTLVIQIIVTQWDKAQQTYQHAQARKALPDRYPISSPPAISLYDGRIMLDQHGDDLMANRLKNQLVDDQYFLIDRFRFCLNTQTVEFKQKLEATAEPILLTQLEAEGGWEQYHYQWRYRVDEGGFIYWLYEAITLNAVYTDSEVVPADCFMRTSPKHCFKQLMTF